MLLVLLVLLFLLVLLVLLFLLVLLVLLFLLVLLVLLLVLRLLVPRVLPVDGVHPEPGVNEVVDPLILSLRKFDGVHQILKFSDPHGSLYALTAFSQSSRSYSNSHAASPKSAASLSFPRCRTMMPVT